MMDNIPHNREAEEALIGSVLINPTCYYDVAAFLTTDDFYIHKHRWIWEAFTALIERGIPIDQVAVTEHLSSKDRLAELGGASYLTGLLSVTPTAMNAETYGHIVEDYSMRRRALVAANSMAKAAFDLANPFDPGQYLDDALRTSRFSGRRTNTENLSAYMDWYMRRLEHPGQLSGMTSGLSGLDLITEGYEKGTTTMFAGAEGIGKSMFAAQQALTMARYGLGAVIYSLEISDIMIINRWVSVMTSIEAHHIKHGNLTETQQGMVADAIGRLEKLPIDIVHDPFLTTSQIRADIMRRKSAGANVDFIVIDYSGKLADKAERGQEDLDRKAACIGRVVNIGISMDVAIFLIHTLNDNDGISGRRAARYDVDVKALFTKTPGYGDGPEADRHTTITITKLRDQNMVGASNHVRLCRQAKFPWFEEEKA